MLENRWITRKDSFSFMWEKPRNATTRSPPHQGQPRIGRRSDRPDLLRLAAQPNKTATLVGKTMRVHGEMYSEEELYMDGEFEGTLEVRQRLTIGPNGKIKANVKAKDLEVKGLIQGNVEAADRIVIMNGASIVGDVKTAGIVIEDGAFFERWNRYSAPGSEAPGAGILHQVPGRRQPVTPPRSSR